MMAWMVIGFALVVAVLLLAMILAGVAVNNREKRKRSYGEDEKPKRGRLTLGEDGELVEWFEDEWTAQEQQRQSQG